MSEHGARRGWRSWLFADPAPRRVGSPEEAAEAFELQQTLQLWPRQARERFVGKAVRTWGLVHGHRGRRLYLGTRVGGSAQAVCVAHVLDPSYAPAPGAPVVVQGTCRGLDPQGRAVLRPSLLVDDSPKPDELSVRRTGAHLVPYGGGALVMGGWDAQMAAPALSVEQVDHLGVKHATQLPGDRRPAAVVVSHDGVVFAIGGRRGVSEAVRDVHRYSAGHWREGPDLPEPWTDGVAAPVGGGILVAGGVGDGRLVGLTDFRRNVWWLGPRAMGWDARAQLVQPRKGGRLFSLHDGRAIWIGGVTPEGEAHTALIYDAHRNTWTELPLGRAPISRRGAAVLRDGRILLAGGHVEKIHRRLGASSAEMSSHVHLFDPDGHILSALPGLSVARRDPTVVALPDGTAMVLGGEVEGDDGGVRPSAAVDRIHPGQRAVQLQSPLVVPRSHPGVALVHQAVAVVGGLGPGHQPLRSLERRHVPSRVHHAQAEVYDLFGLDEPEDAPTDPFTEDLSRSRRG
ncbi:MAG: hypothetical protein KTR31_28330 [Myxococcales bacterium]|nr:hypothetical protein [Myxococcales bacterium]